MTVHRPRSTVYALLSAIASGLLLSSSFAPLEWAGVAWAALVPLLIVIRYSTPRASFKWGWVAGFAFWLTSIFWLTHVTLVGWFFLSALCAVFIGLFACSCSWWMARFGTDRLLPNLGCMALAAVSWAGLEYLRSVVASGFPWNPLGASQYQSLPLIQVASFGGVHMVSAVVVWVSTGMGLTVLRYIASRGHWNRRPHLELFASLVVVALVFMHGMRVLKQKNDAGVKLRVALIQPNIEQDEKWDEAKTELINTRLGELTESALYTQPDLIVWPETALPDDLRSSDKSYELVYQLATQGVPILVGTMDTALRDDGPHFFNSSFLIDTDGIIAQTYDKRHLVPFGEYIPFRNALPFMKAMTPIQESFDGGKTSVVFQLDKPLARFSALICFEDTVAKLARLSVRNGARMIVNQTNDAWFDPAAASRQHMAQCVMRCVENRVPAIRSANTGVTCYIDAQGRVREQLKRLVAGFKTMEVTLAPDEMALTFYTRYGDWFGAISAVVTLIAVLFALRRAQRVSAQTANA